MQSLVLNVTASEIELKGGVTIEVDADYLVELRRLKARKALEHGVLWNLANPNPNYMAA